MIFLQKLQIEVRVATSQFDAVTSCMATLVEEFHKPNGISARQTVINVLECTNLIPGVFNVHMLTWRQRLHEILFNPQIVCPFSSLNYPLLLAVENTNGTSTRSIGIQTTLTHPDADMLEFKSKSYSLRWVLDTS